MKLQLCMRGGKKPNNACIVCDNLHYVLNDYNTVSRALVALQFTVTIAHNFFELWFVHLDIVSTSSDLTCELREVLSSHPGQRRLQATQMFSNDQCLHRRMGWSTRSIATGSES